jgi:hypothetical protein
MRIIWDRTLANHLCLRTRYFDKVKWACNKHVTSRQVASWHGWSCFQPLDHTDLQFNMDDDDCPKE